MCNARLTAGAIALGLASAVTGAAARADVVAIGALKDNTLYEDPLGRTSNGAGDYFFSGLTAAGEIRRGLVAFDVAGAVPAGSTITSVLLSLHMSRAFGAESLVALHRLTNDWGEGGSDAPGEEGAGTDATPGDATWLHTFYNDQFWASPGGDFVAAVSATRLVGGVGFYTWPTTDESVLDVQTWLDDPGSNFGWMLRGDEGTPFSAKRFDSRDHPLAEFRPLLTIEYTAIPAPPAAALLAAAFGLGWRRGRGCRGAGGRPLLT